MAERIEGAVRIKPEDVVHGMELTREDLPWPNGALRVTTMEDRLIMFPVSGGFAIKLEVLNEFPFRVTTEEDKVPRFRRVKVEIEDGPETFEAIVVNTTWNGWAKPYFTLEVAKAVCAWVTREDQGWWRYHEPDDAFLTVFTDDDSPYDWPAQTIQFEGQELKLYPVGAGSWVWSVALPDIDELRELFDKVNEDCAKTGESVVPYSDEEYYAEQIVNLFNVDISWADDMAEQLHEGDEDPDNLRANGPHQAKYRRADYT